MATANLTASWNLLTNTAEFSTDGSTSTTPASAPVTLSPGDSTVASASAPSLNYYVRFTLSDGSVFTLNGDQFFALDDFSFSDQQTATIGSQTGGAGAGTATFSPLQLTFSQVGLQPELLELLASGAHFSEVDVLGYNQSDNHLVTDDSFGLVFPTNLAIDASGAAQVSLAYGSEAIQQSTQLPDGTYSAPVVDAWSVTTNSAIFSTDGVARASLASAPVTLSPGDSTVSSASAPSLDYYVRFTLTDGSVFTLNGDPFVPLDDFSFSDQQTATVGSQTGGAGAGTATFSPLQLTLPQVFGLQPELLELLASGAHFSEVDVLGYSQSGNHLVTHLVTDDSFGLVFPTNLAIDASGAAQVSLAYGSEAIQQSTQLPDGTYSAPVVDTWNLRTNSAEFSTVGSAPTTPASAPVTLPPGDSMVASSGPSVNYYVRFTLSDGSVFTLNGDQFFALDDFSFSDQRTGEIAGQTGGTATFNPLQLTFSQVGLQPELLELLASGAHFSEVDVLGYNQSDNHLVTDDSFGLVFPTNLAIDASGAAQVSLAYGSEAIQQSTQLPDGTYSAPVVDAWSVTTNSAIFSTDGVARASPASAPVTLSPGDRTVSSASAPSLNYYVRFTLSDGSVVTLNGSKFFALDDFSFSDQQTATIGSQTGGAGAGRATFSPLQLTFSQVGLQPELLELLASGAHFSEVDVLGYNQSDNHLVTDDSFGLVFPTNLAIDASGAAQVSLAYGSEAIQQSTQLPDGTYSAPVVDAWSVTTNSAIFSTDGVARASLASAPVTLSPGDLTVSSASAPSLDYYVRFTLTDGSVVTLNGGEFFALDDFSFSDQQTATIGSQTGGAGAGRATFSPLQLTFSQVGLQPELYKILAPGAHFSEVDVLGYNQSDNHLVTDDSFGLVVPTNLAIDASGAAQVSLAYGSEAIQQSTLLSSGTYSAPVVDAWSVTTNTAEFSTDGSTSTTPASAPVTLSPGDSTVASASAPSLNYYVRFTLTDGSVFTLNGAELFALDDFSFSDQHTTTIGSQTGGAGAGRVTFSPLQLTFSQVGLQPELLELLTSGSHFSEVDVLGYSQSDNHLVTNDSFGLVLPTNFAIDASGAAQVSLTYGSEAITSLVDPGPSVTDTTTSGEKVAHGATVAVGTATPGLPGDTLALTEITGPSGAVTLSGGVVSFAAPANGGNVGFSYQISDQLGDLSAIVSDTLAVDPGPTAGNGAVTEGHGEMVSLSALINGLITPGLPGDTETLTSVTAAHALALLGPDNAVTYTAPATGPDTISYTVQDQLGDTASGQVAVTVDPGPTAGSGAVTEGHGKTVSLTTLINGLITPGLLGDTETLTAVSAVSGTATLGSGNAVTYTAPTTGPDTISYTVQDQLGDTASGQVAVTVDPGPTAGSGAVTEGHGKTVSLTTLINGLITPGLLGDTETLTAVSAVSGTATLGSGNAVTYIAPTTGPDTISYTVQDQLGDTASGQVAVTVDPGPTAGSGAVTEGHGKTVSLTTLINGLITPGLLGDTETLTAVSAVSGTATLGSGNAVTYTAPTTGPDTISYTVQDQLGDTASGQVAVTVDPGPSVTDTTPLGEKVAHGATVVVGAATPGLAGDTLSLTELSGPAAAVTLSGGVVSFAAPANGGNVPFSYQIGDQLGDLSSIVADTLAVDPGPTAGNGTVTEGHGETVSLSALINGLITPGLPGDTETLTSVTAARAIALLGPDNAVTYTAPASGSDTISYTVQDQLGDTASGQVAVTVDPGPTAGNANLDIAPGQSLDLTNLLLALDTPGLPGDTLSLTAAGTSGTKGKVTLNNGDLSYTAPAGGSSDAFTYTVSDEFQDTAVGDVKVSLNASLSKNANIALTGSGNIVVGGNGNDAITGGSGSNSITLGGGNDTVSLTGNNNTITLGNGNDNIQTSGLNNMITVGSGTNTIVAGSGSDTVVAGTGNDTITLAGTGNVVTAGIGGKGNDAVTGGTGNATITLGNGNDNIQTSGLNNMITVGSGTNTIVAGSGDDTVIANGGQDTLTFAGPSSTANIFGSATTNISDLGSTLTVRAESSTQVDSIRGLGTDGSWLLDIMNGAGGFSSVASVVNALHSDGHGGTMLSLGASGSVDFVNLALSQIHAANFKIG